jgi:hypothetical protein
MHRSRLTVLVLFALATACSTQDDAEVRELLSQDPTLVARLAMDQETRQVPLPDACGGTTIAAQPAVASKSEAAQLTRQAYEAETLGNVEGARSLLRRASELDATNKSAAYHLGRASEALGDRAAAIDAYCRYLALTPSTAESAEARQRVATLSRSETRVAAGRVDDGASTRRRAPAATARRVTRARPTATPRVVASAPVASAPVASAPVASASVERSMPATSPARATPAASAAASAADDAPSRTAPASDAPAATDTAYGTTAAGDVMATSHPVPAVVVP